jgi:IS30 family transposase
MPNENFNPCDALSRLRADAKIRRKKSYRRSKLELVAGELMQLHRAGATPAELQRWLASERRIRVTHSTVARWLRGRDIG